MGLFKTRTFLVVFGLVSGLGLGTRLRLERNGHPHVLVHPEDVDMNVVSCTTKGLGCCDLTE